MKLYPLKYIDISTGERIAYREAGEGETVILLHGNMSSSVHWTKTMKGLADEYHVYAPDMRGFGDSSYNKRGTVLLTYARDIVAFMEALNLTDVHLVGWSAGGGVAMEVCATPEGQKRVRDLTVLSSVGVQGTQDIKENFMKHLPSTGKGMGNGFGLIPVPEINPMEAFTDTLEKFTPKLAESVNELTVKNLWKYAIYNIHMPPEDEFEENIKATMKQRNLKDILQALKTFNITSQMSDYPGSGRINDIKVPVMWVHGDKDRVISVEDAKFSKQFFPGEISLKVFKNAGHSIMTDNLDVFVQLLKDFFKGVTGKKEV